jgi:hypothetical protein
MGADTIAGEPEHPWRPALVALLMALAALPAGVAAGANRPLDAAWFSAAVSPMLTSTIAAEGALPALDMELVGQLGGRVQAVDVRGDLAYVGMGRTVAVIDVGDHAAPTVVGRSRPLSSDVRCVSVAGERAFASVWYGRQVYVIDVGDPSSPAVVGSVSMRGWAATVAASGDYAYVIDLAGGLAVVDARDLHAPRVVAYADFGGSPWDLAVSGGIAYVTDAATGLRVVDVSDPRSPRQVGGLAALGAWGVAVSGDLVVMTTGDSVRLADVSDPRAPEQLGSLTAELASPFVAVEDGHAYVVTGDFCVMPIDISDPQAPRTEPCFLMPNFVLGVRVSAGTAYIATNAAGLQLVDVRNPQTPHVLGATDLPAPSEVALAGDYAYAGGGDGRLDVVDVRDPSSPRTIGHLAGNDQYAPLLQREVAVWGSAAYMTDSDLGLRVVDVGSPSTPRDRGRIETPGAAVGVAVVDGYAYVADGQGGLRVLDVRGPGPPLELSSAGSDAFGVAVSGDYAYVCGHTSLLSVIDIRDPAVPHQVGVTSGVPGSSWCRVTTTGRMAYVVGPFDDMLTGIDVGDPSAPVVVSSESMTELRDVAASGGYVYVAAVNLEVLAASESGAPRAAGRAFIGAGVDGVAVRGDLVYLAAAYDGLLIYRTRPAAAGSAFMPFAARGAQLAAGWHTGSGR